MSIRDRLSFQLYSARKFPPLAQQIEILAGLGFPFVEPYGGLLDDLGDLTAALDAQGLKAPSSHIGLGPLEKDLEGAVAIARSLGTDLLIVPAIGPAERPTDAEGWRGFGKTLAGIQTVLQPHGIRFAWHNHDFEFARTHDGQVPLDLIFEAAPDLLWEADIGWIERAGQDTTELLTRYRDRVVAIHIKDLAPAGENADEDGWADVGHGVIDWAALMPAIEATNAELFVLEHDNPSDFERFADRSYKTVSTW